MVSFIFPGGAAVLIGYVRVSKSDGTQTPVHINSGATRSVVERIPEHPLRAGRTIMAFRDWGRPAVVDLSLSVVTVLAGLGLASTRVSALNIIPSFDTSITAAPDAGAIENSINRVIDTYERLIADPVDATIFFNRAPLPNDRASQSKASLYAVGYFLYTGQMIVDAVFNDNPVLTTAIINLASGNQADMIVATSADLRALDFIAPGLLGEDGVRGHGTLDGVITLNSGTNFQYSRPVSPDNIDATWAIAHEINEVLGIGGAGGSNS